MGAGAERYESLEQGARLELAGGSILARRLMAPQVHNNACSRLFALPKVVLRLRRRALRAAIQRQASYSCVSRRCRNPGRCENHR